VLPEFPYTLPPDEEQRLETLREYDILDKPLGGFIDHILKLACDLLGAFDAGLGLVDSERVCYASMRIREPASVPRNTSIGALVALRNEPLVIEDLHKFPQFLKSSVIRGEPNPLFPKGTPPIRFLAAIPLKGMQGHIIGGMGIFDIKPRQVTPIELKILESFASVIMYDLDLRLSQNRLKALTLENSRLEERTRQILSEKLTSLGRMTAGIAHEINTPLQFITTNMEFLEGSVKNLIHALDGLGDLEVLPAPGGQKLRDTDVARAVASEFELDYTVQEAPAALRDTGTGLERVTNLVNALKRFSHTGGSQKKTEQLNGAVRDAALLTRNAWKEIAILELDLAEDLPLVYCEINEINQVILNLIINSVDAIQDQHRPEPGKINIRTSSENDVVVIEIRDDGGGIPDSILHRIFDPFFTTKEVGKGTGQGLAISHDIIVRKHGGRLEVISRSDEGRTVFKIILPAFLGNALTGGE